MSIEQTNQLILLILNSVLMLLLSAVLLGGAWIRQNMLARQIHQLRLHHKKITQRSEATGVPANSAYIKATLKKLRGDRQRLSHQYRWSHIGMLTLHGVLLIFGVSLFSLALRSLLSFDSLVSAALLLFTLGAGGLLMGAGCILIDLVLSEPRMGGHQTTTTAHPAVYSVESKDADALHLVR